MINIQVDHNLGDMQRILNSLSTDIEKKAAVRALNRTIQQAKTAAKREMVKEYSFKSSKIESTIRIFNASTGRVEAKLSSRSRRTRLIDMAARQVKAGTTVRIKNKRKLIKSAFIARMKSGHIGVFSRLTNKSKPIKELYTISIPEAMGSQAVIDSMRKVIGARFAERFKHELNWLSQQASRR